MDTYLDSATRIRIHTYATQKAAGGFTERQLVHNSNRAVTINENNNVRANLVNAGKKPALVRVGWHQNNLATALSIIVTKDIYSNFLRPHAIATMRRHPMRKVLRQDRDRSFHRPTSNYAKGL